MNRKPVVWLGDSRQAVKDFPQVARQRTGRQLAKVQEGLEPESWKLMPSIGLGVNEIRVREGGAFRLIYVAKFLEAVYVLHAFEKRTRQTPQAEIVLAQKRLADLIRRRAQKREAQ